MWGDDSLSELPIALTDIIKGTFLNIALYIVLTIPTVILFTAALFANTSILNLGILCAVHLQDIIALEDELIRRLKTVRCEIEANWFLTVFFN